MKLNYFAGFAALTLVGCFTAKRGEIVALRDLPSPDGRYVCTIFGETFHDTTGYRQHVDLRRAGEKRDHSINVYVVPVGDDVKVWWASPTNLSVGLRFETQRDLPANTNAYGVTVTFSKIDR
jgi:hypothetical protein